MRSEVTAAIPHGGIGVGTVAASEQATGAFAEAPVREPVTRLAALRAHTRDAPVSLNGTQSATSNPEYPRILQEQVGMLGNLRAVRRQVSPIARPESAMSLAGQRDPR